MKKKFRITPNEGEEKMDKETTEERNERFKKAGKELKSSKDYQDFMSIRIFLLGEDFSNFMLFRINNNLKRIADSLDAIFLKM